MTNRNRFRLSKLSLALVVALAAMPALAQNTTSALGGRISGSDGKPVAGADVAIVHTPSGTVSHVTTDAGGRYIARGLRVGGPYTVTVSKDGKTDTEKDVFLQLAETQTVDAQLDTGAASAAATNLKVIEVTGTRLPAQFGSNKMGAGTSINRQQIEALPSIKRNLQDYARLDPRISQTDKERGEISAGGQNTRFNSITIDGVNTSDTFGLEANNLPTAKQPISIDAIQAVQVNLSNYDVTQTAYTGANINAVTKSGTNDFHGSLYYVFRNDRLTGDRFNRTDGSYAAPPPFVERTKGFTLGGPIVPGRLFFFASYEDFTSSRSAPSFGPIGGTQTNVGISQANIDAFRNIAQNTYHIDVGTLDIPTGTKLQVKDKLLKLDWNISDSQRASLRYNKTDQSEPIFPDFGSRSLALSSNWYTQGKAFESVVGQLFSDWTATFSTELKLSYRTYDSAPVNNARLPQIQVQFPPTPGFSGFQTLFAGTERSRQDNQLNTKTFNGYLGANWYLGDHALKFGADYDRNNIFNAFLQDTYGNYTFSSLAGFQNATPVSYQSQQPAPGLTLADGAANWTLKNLGVFVQDSWKVNDKLTLTYGARLDTPMVDQSPLFNAAAAAPTVLGAAPFGRQTGGFGFRNDVTIDGRKLFEPRVGFNYLLSTEHPTQIRGGIGLFQGAAANVWLSNPYSNTGLSTRIFGCGGSFGSCTGVTFNPNPDIQPLPAGNPPAANVDFIDPRLAQPSVWKSNLAFETELPWNTVLTAEYIRTDTKTGIFYEHLNLGLPTRIGTDGRELFYSASGYNKDCFTASGAIIVGGLTCGGANAVRTRARNNTAYNNVLIARPTDQGYGNNFTIGLSRPMKDNWSWSLAYSYTSAKDVSPLTSSVSNSNWNGRNIFNPNEETLGNSNYLTHDRIVGSVDWRHNFFRNYKTEFALFYEGRSGKPYSWTYINDLNGDGVAGNDLMYVPRPNDGTVIFRDVNGNLSSADEQAAFFAVVDANPALAAAQGGIVKRNSSFGRWVNSFDFRISQQFPGFFRDNKAVVVLDVLNIGNLINRKWGHIDEIGFPSNRSFVNYAGQDAQGRYIYALGRTEDFVTRQQNNESQWAAQLTFRYEF